ncbi:hypothetical protein DR64_5578 [Paraburkholderia xenovorans LB400]|uniref:hypothetical protein n=1 Tax=Paraburkholderia xenovorans TaxID=36873 RepID=UPI00003C4162|nr:hypothetical protein [Paraburkholderia xenovorans]AIP37907.1 hypothetical protein DR64_5578 [Paraburkholderia xenovorans LB400]
MAAVAEANFENALVCVQIEQIERRCDNRAIRAFQHIADRYADFSRRAAELGKENAFLQVGGRHLA